MLFVTAGLLSLAVAASLLLSQRDYNACSRTTASSTWVSSPWPAAGTHSHRRVLLHVLATAREGRFVSRSGEILIVRHDRDRPGEALLARRPASRRLRLRAVTLLGLPPFSLFISELNMLRAEVHVGLGWSPRSRSC